jgi:ankyrin repeat protein
MSTHITQDVALFKIRLSRGFYAWNINDVMNTVMKNPNVLSNCGKTLALQKACDMDRECVSIELIRLLILEGSKQNFGERGGLRVPTARTYGSAPLQILVKRGSLKVLRFLSEESSPPLLCKDDVSNFNLLHFAAGHGHVDVVKFLMKLDPDAIYSRDQSDALPIHMTCKKGQSDFATSHMIRKILLEEYIQQNHLDTNNNNDNNIMIHSDEEEKQQEVEQEQETIDEEHAMAILEWFFPCVHTSKRDIATYVEDIANIMNCHSVSIPLLCAAIRVDAPHSHIKCILDLVKNAAFVRDHDNRLPIHHAVERGMSWSNGLKDIVDANPTAVSEIDCKTCLYPFLSAAISSGGGVISCCDLNSLYSLLQMNPELTKCS